MESWNHTDPKPQLSPYPLQLLHKAISIKVERGSGLDYMVERSSDLSENVGKFGADQLGAGKAEMKHFSMFLIFPVPALIYFFCVSNLLMTISTLIILQNSYRV